jgi:hypothetical protein
MTKLLILATALLQVVLADNLADCKAKYCAEKMYIQVMPQVRPFVLASMSIAMLTKIPL